MNTPNALILDTETHDLNGFVIQLAHAELQFQPHNGQSTPIMLHETLVNEMYSIGDQKITHGSMAVHNIIDSDLIGKPHTSSIQLPFNEGYIIGHNIDYDINALQLSTGQPCELKPICTLALARLAWPNIENHKLTTLIYHIYGSTEFARKLVQNSHDAATDIRNTAHVVTAICSELQIQSIEELYEVGLKARIPTIMAFGKHKGMPISEVPIPYMSWYIAKSDNPDPYVLQAFHEQINQRKYLKKP